MIKAVVQSTCSKYELTEITSVFNRHYADRIKADYYLHIDKHKKFQHPAWGKIHSIVELFDKGYEFILLLDGDAVVLDWSRNIFTELYPEEDRYENETFLHACSDGTGDELHKINSGVMLIKNNYLSRCFFNNILEPSNTQLFNSRNWEQDAIQAEIKKDINYFKHHIKVYDKDFFNHESDWIYHPCYDADNIKDKEKEIFLKLKLKDIDLEV